MVILRFRSSAEHEDILKKVKKMKKFAAELEDCLEEVMEDEEEYRYRGSYRDDEETMSEHHGNRYAYRGGRGGRM